MSSPAQNQLTHQRNWLQNIIWRREGDSNSRAACATHWFRIRAVWPTPASLRGAPIIENFATGHQVGVARPSDEYSSLRNKLVKEYAKRYPERRRAQWKVREAIKKGKLVKESCIICGNEKVHGHHQDYSKPLEVIWLCAKHHKALHYDLLETKVEL